MIRSRSGLKAYVLINTELGREPEVTEAQRAYLEALAQVWKTYEEAEAQARKEEAEG
jgi:hypothetical protein